MRLDIEGIDKTILLIELYRRARLVGGKVTEVRAPYLSVLEAETILAHRTRFDYLYGRAMKIDISNDEVGASCYDIYNGAGKAAEAIESARIVCQALRVLVRQQEAENAMPVFPGSPG